MIEILSQPWHWLISGASIVLVMIMLLWFGGEFGVSANLRTLCAMTGGGKDCDFFDFDWRSQIWNLVFIIGAIGGGVIATQYLGSPQPVQISEGTIDQLSALGINTPDRLEEGLGFVPGELFANPFDLGNLVILVVGGFLVGFGARYAGGCTSGHAISGLSNLQLPSLIAVLGFFLGGLIMTWFLFPIIF